MAPIPASNDITVKLFKKDSLGEFVEVSETTTVNNPENGNPGWYQFLDLVPGDYQVQFERSDFEFTKQYATAPASFSDSDADVNGRSGTITLTAGQYDPTIDAGLIDRSLAVSLGYFLAEQDGDTVNFTWQTATETGTAGFNLLAESDGDLVQLNPELIPSTVIDSVEPTDYSYEATSTATVFYIEEIRSQWQDRSHRPVRIGDARAVSIPGSMLNLRR